MQDSNLRRAVPNRVLNQTQLNPVVTYITTKVSIMENILENIVKNKICPICDKKISYSKDFDNNSCEHIIRLSAQYQDQDIIALKFVSNKLIHSKFICEEYAGLFILCIYPRLKEFELISSIITGRHYNFSDNIDIISIYKNIETLGKLR